MDASARILAKRYARAYLGLSGKSHGAAAVKAAGEKLDGLRKVFEAARPNMKALTHPAVNSSVRVEVLKKVLGPAAAGHAGDFAELLVRKNRFGLLEEIMQQALRLADDFSGVVRAEVCSRYPLSAGELERITALLTGASGRKIVLRQIIAERVVGGFEVKVGDTLIDATVRGRLDALRAGLLKG